MSNYKILDANPKHNAPHSKLYLTNYICVIRHLHLFILSSFLLSRIIYVLLCLKGQVIKAMLIKGCWLIEVDSHSWRQIFRRTTNPWLTFCFSSGTTWNQRISRVSSKSYHLQSGWHFYKLNTLIICVKYGHFWYHWLGRDPVILRFQVPTDWASATTSISYTRSFHPAAAALRAAELLSSQLGGEENFTLLHQLSADTSESCARPLLGDDVWNTWIRTNANQMSLYCQHYVWIIITLPLHFTFIAMYLALQLFSNV